jgi:hypothetical protein
MSLAFDELKQGALFWWPAELCDADEFALNELLRTQDDFLNILSLSKATPYQVFDLLIASQMPVNLFLKHCSVLADYGGESINRLGKHFNSIFPKKRLAFVFNMIEYEYFFSALPVKDLGNAKLKLDGKGLTTQEKTLSPLYKDMIMLLLFGGLSTRQDTAGLETCEIGSYLGDTKALKQLIKQRYLIVSRITTGAKSNRRGQVAQHYIISELKKYLAKEYTIKNNERLIFGTMHEAISFDVLIEKDNLKVGVEVSFQVTTNSTIERKAKQAEERKLFLNQNNVKVVYIIDGAGNFNRQSAITSLIKHSDYSCNFSKDAIKQLAQWIQTVC